MSDKKNSPKENTEARRKAVLDYLLEFGPFGIPTSTKDEYAKNWDCDVRTISRDIDFIITHVKVPKMQKMGQKFLLGYEKAIKVAAQMMQSSKPKEKIKGVELYNQTQTNYTKMCEKYGFKEVIADKIEVEGNLNYNSLTKEERQAEIKRLLGK